MRTSRKPGFRLDAVAEYQASTASSTGLAPQARIEQPRAAGLTGLPALREAHDPAARRDLTEWTRSLELRLAEQAKEIARLSKLKQFVPSQLVDLILSDNADELLKSHRREIVVVFVDLRGFTAFAETAAPEEVSQVLGEYQREVGRAALAHEGTLERFTGDGVMIFFNDPVPIAEPAQRAVRMALDVRARLQALCERWRNVGYELDFGIGIAQGYATIGAIGFEGRWDYAAIGTVTNLASRLCAQAQAGQILMTQRIAHALEAPARTLPRAGLKLKGFLRPVVACRVA